MGRNRVQWLAIGLPALLVGAFEFFRHRWLEHTLPGPWGNAVGAVLVAAGVFGFIRYFAGAVARAEQELGRARAEAAVLAERQRIAREMHDGVAQALFHLRVRIQQVDKMIAGGTVDAARPELATLQAQVAAAHEQVRQVIHDLKQTGGSDLREAVHRESAILARELGVRVNVLLADLPPTEPALHHHLLAVIREAITNAHRHGGATLVRVEGRRNRLTVADNGLGFVPSRAAGGGFGLEIIAERARLIGANLAVQSAPGRGTTVTLTWEDGGDEVAPGDRGR